ncbi:sugar MFS transporter [Coralloluteibacterium stylophorae]|uniref:Sugar MFS transporter n=1 Tax=Coralloluteibacterium stylophorae TaxID=1776034 RepID=A0A8J7VR72_9GAMM|nr:sugar MFS transporter [Coralloluteibacterium stylophorae]MBS7455793.1 sugar MFS transporter [Coralloluteibacterium stylophorae]
MTEPRSTHGTALAVATTVFFMWGLLTSLNDVLIPHFQTVFALNYTISLLVQSAFFGAYFVMSVPAGRLVGRVGYQRGMAIGLVVSGLGALLFWPAAAAPSYPLFLCALFVLASGITTLQVAANPYVGLLGPERLASSRLNLAQAMNSLGATLGPKLGGVLIFSAAALGAAELAQLPPAEALAYQHEQARALQMPYLVLALVLFGLAVFLFRIRLAGTSDTGAAAAQRRPRLGVLLQHRGLLLAVLGIFIYVGTEVAIGSLLINYLALPEVAGLSHADGATYVTYYWGTAMVGRFVGFALLRTLDAGRVLGAAGLAAAALVLLSVVAGGEIALWAIVAVGLFNSVMFPTIFSLGIRGMGAATSSASSLLVMAIVGGALFPLAQGAIADTVGLRWSFLLPACGYLYIVFYGFIGSRGHARVDDAQA